MADRSKRAKLDEGDASDQFDTDLVNSVHRLQEVQDELEKVNEEASERVLEVEQKYNEVRRPIYSKRNEIIQGIPDFWLTAFLCHPALCELLNDEDQQVFKYLEFLDVEDFKDVKSGYSIIFMFRSNPYFEDKQLVKVYRFSDDGTLSVTGTQPRWKDGMNLTNGVIKNPTNKWPPTVESFFKWFTETDKDFSIGVQDEIAEIIKEDLWPNPLKYFNNEVDDDEDDESDDEDEEDDEQVNGDDDDGEEESDEEDPDE